MTDRDWSQDPEWLRAKATDLDREADRLQFWSTSSADVYERRTRARELREKAKRLDAAREASS